MLSFLVVKQPSSADTAKWLYKVVVPISSPIQQNMRVLISLHSHELLDLSVFSIIVIPVDVL